MSNDYAPCFNRIDFVVIPSYIELPCMSPSLRKLPDYIILHIGINYALDNTSRVILDKILKLKTYIQKVLTKCKITISTPIKRHDHGKHH